MDKRCIGVFDAAYSSAYGVAAFHDEQPGDAVFIARLRGNRILQRPYTGKQSGKGRPICFDTSFAVQVINISLSFELTAFLMTSQHC